MRLVEEVIHQLLIDAEQVGDPESPSAPDWPAYVNTEPVSPDNCITVIGTAGTVQGRFQVDGEVQGMEGLQIRLRSNDQAVGYQKLWEIQQYLDQTVYRETVELAALEGTSVESFEVHSVTRQGQILRLGQDQENHSCFLFTLNYLVSFKEN